jgi:capsule polysaccharide export protein KpsE/RkpR
MGTHKTKATPATHHRGKSETKVEEARLNTLKARLDAIRANVEAKAITELLTKKQVIQQKLRELKKTGGDRWEQAKADVEGRIADFEKSVKEIESKAS